VKYTRVLIISVLMLQVSSCATPYQEYGLSGGYTEEYLGNNLYEITFHYNIYTSVAKAIHIYWPKRASEVCGGPEKYKTITKAKAGIFMKIVGVIKCI